MTDRETRAKTNSGTSSLADTLLRLEASLKTIEAKLDTNVATLTKSIEDSKIELRDEFRAEMQRKIQTNFASIEVNSADIAILQDEVDRLDDIIDANSRACDLLVKGIPLQPGENCSTIYLSIATAIGYTDNYAPLVEVFRLGAKKPGSKFDPPLILRFANRIERNIFHQKYFAMRNLALNHIGFQTNSRIIISENLTKSSQSIFAAAMKLKHDAKLVKVTTLRGTVYVKPCGKDKSVPVKLLSDLDCYSDKTPDADRAE
jgi:hypothetical protein